MQCTTESPAVRSAPPSSPELHCVLAVQQWGETGHLVKPCSPAECKWAAITWVLMTHLNKRRGCDFALLLPRAAVLQGRGLWISQCTMDIAMALCFLNTELKGALYHVLLSRLQHRASAWLLAGGSTEPSGAEERISLL